MKVKVWNKNVHPYKEEFRDQKIDIPAGEFIMMEYDDAKLFQGSFSPPVRNGDGQPDPRYFKMIVVEEPAAVEMTKNSQSDLLCQKCRYLALTKPDLINHLQSHSDDAVVDQDAEREIVRKKASRAS